MLRPGRDRLRREPTRVSSTWEAALSSTSTSTCVYCPNPADGREHWFPRWLGNYRNHEELTDRICDDCNQALGRELDQAMSREGPQALNRQLLGIEGRHDGKARDVFTYKGQSAEPPTISTAQGAPGIDYEPLTRDSIEDGEHIKVWLPHVVVRDSRNRPYPIVLTPGVPEDWLRKAIEKRGIDSPRISDVACDPHNPTDPESEWEIPGWMRRLFFVAVPAVREQAQEFGIRVRWLTAGGTERIVLRSMTQLGLSALYFRALAKIAFHYVLKMDHAFTGHEAMFEQIKRFIRHGEGDARTFVDLSTREFVLDTGFTIRGVHHFLLEDIERDGRLRVRMRFFLKGPYATLPTVVTLGQDPFTRLPQIAHAFRLYPEPVDGFDGELVPAKIGQFDGLTGVYPPPWAGTTLWRP
jgi:hypothetical protein